MMKETGVMDKKAAQIYLYNIQGIKVFLLAKLWFKSFWKIMD